MRKTIWDNANNLCQSSQASQEASLGLKRVEKTSDDSLGL